MNLIKANSDGNNLTLENGISLKCSTNFMGEVLAGLRPEDLIPNKNGEIVIKIEILEPIGASTIIHGKLKNSDIKIISMVQGLINQKDMKKELSFSISPDSVHLFDRKLGKRISE